MSSKNSVQENPWLTALTTVPLIAYEAGRLTVNGSAFYGNYTKQTLSNGDEITATLKIGDKELRLDNYCPARSVPNMTPSSLGYTGEKPTLDASQGGQWLQFYSNPTAYSQFEHVVNFAKVEALQLITYFAVNITKGKGNSAQSRVMGKILDMMLNSVNLPVDTMSLIYKDQEIPFQSVVLAAQAHSLAYDKIKQDGELSGLKGKTVKASSGKATEAELKAVPVFDF